jgi:hypothetical protein
VADQAVELPITFAGGSGLTEMISPGRIVFTTGDGAWLTVGTILPGSIHFPPGDDGLVTTVRFVARITHIEPLSVGDTTLVQVAADLGGLEFQAKAADG